MNTSLDGLLNDCLDRLRAGETVPVCLARYPDHAGELAPLLEVAWAVTRSTEDVTPAPAYRATARADFEARLATAARGAALRRPHPLDMISRRLPWIAALPRTWAAPMAAVLVLVSLGAGTVAAAARSLPDESLYGVKLAAERAQHLFAFGAQAEARQHLRAAERRVDELATLRARGLPVPDSLLQAARTATDQVIQALASSPPDTGLDAKQQTLEGLAAVIRREEATLTGILDRASAQVATRLQGAIAEAAVDRDRVDTALTTVRALRGDASAGDVRTMTTRLHTLETHGIIQAIAAGTWRVDGRTVRITEATRITADARVGKRVLLRLRIQPDGVLSAIEISPVP